MRRHSQSFGPARRCHGLRTRPSQNLTHWSVFQGRESPAYQPRVKSSPHAKNGPGGDVSHSTLLGSSPSVREEASSLGSNRFTLVGCHLPPFGVGIPRLLNSRVMALMETKPAL
jgi:hypothetical protein